MLGEAAEAEAGRAGISQRSLLSLKSRRAFRPAPGTSLRGLRRGQEAGHRWRKIAWACEVPMASLPQRYQVCQRFLAAASPTSSPKTLRSEAGEGCASS